MNRWLAPVVLACVIGAGATVISGSAEASSTVPGLGPCPFITYCDLFAVHDTFPDYRGLCAAEGCGVVAAADWEVVATGVVPSRAALTAAIRASGHHSSPGSDFGPLWNYWTVSGLAGESLASHAQVGRGETAVKDAIVTGAAVIAVDSSRRASLIGALDRAPGTVDLVADGFTLTGPLVVYRQRTVQMTWAQWAAQVRAVWLPAVRAAPSAANPAVTLSVDPPSLGYLGGNVTLKYSAPTAVSCSLSSSPDLWWTPTISVPCVGSRHVSIASAPAGQTVAFSLTAQEANGVTVTQPELLSVSAAPPSNQVATPIWSGVYVPSAGATFSSVSGRFVVPTLNCAATPLGLMSAWDGLGGQNWATGRSSGDLLQTGVTSMCLSGVQNNLAWWELWPTFPDIEVNYYNFPVLAGDVIDASVFQLASGQWETLLSDETSGLTAQMVTGGSWGVGPTGSPESALEVQGSSAGVRYGGGRTAEWIVEDPLDTLNFTTETFANYGSVPFSDLAASPYAPSLDPGHQLDIVQGGVPLSALTSVSGDGFTVAYTGP